MASTSTSTSTGDGKIILNFAWQGPNRWGDSLEAREVLLVSLVFKDATKQVCVDLPKNINPTVPGKFAFTVQNGSETTRSRLLNVAIEKVRHLDLVVDISGSQKTESRKVALEIPETLEPGQTCTLLITSKEFEFSACLVKEETKKESGMKEGTLPAGQQPTPTPSRSASESDRLSVDELQTRLADCFQRDKDLEVARLRTKNVMERRAIMLQKTENLIMLVELGAVLEGRGIRCQLPDTERYKATASEAERLVRENMQEQCSLQ